MTQIVAQNTITNRSQAFGSITLPSYSNVLGEWWFGSSATGLANRVTGVNAVGSNLVAAAAGYQTTSYDGITYKYLTADVGIINQSCSILALVRTQAMSAATQYAFVTPSTPANNFNMLCYGPNIISAGLGGYYNSVDQAAINHADATKFVMVMGVIVASNPATFTRIYQTTGGAVPATTFDDGTYGTTTTTMNISPLLIGKPDQVSMRGAVDIAAMALVDGAQGQPFLESVYARWYGYATNVLGLTVA